MARCFLLLPPVACVDTRIVLSAERNCGQVSRLSCDRRFRSNPRFGSANRSGRTLYPRVSLRCTRARVTREFARLGISVDARATRCSPCCAEKLGKAEHAGRTLLVMRGSRTDSIRAKTRRDISRLWDLRRRRRHWRANSMKAQDRFARTSACGRCIGNRTSTITSRRTFRRLGVHRANRSGLAVRAPFGERTYSRTSGFRLERSVGSNRLVRLAMTLRKRTAPKCDIERREGGASGLRKLC